MLDDWVAAAAAELDVPAAWDTDALLDVTKDVAHQVQRPAAPLTTFLIGVAVGRGMDLADANARVRSLVTRWEAPDGS